MTQAYGSNANDETSILMTTDESTITLTPTPLASSNKSKVVKGLVALGCVAATVAVAGVKMAETASTTTAMPVEPMTLQTSSSIVGAFNAGVPMAFNLLSSKGLCIDQRADGPDSLALYIERCDERAEDQVFRFSQSDGRMRPINDRNMCWTADRETGLLVLGECDKANEAQAIVYDPPTLSFRIKGTDKCLSTLGAGARPALAFTDCDRSAAMQKFALTPRTGRPPNDDGAKKQPNNNKNGDDDDEVKGTQPPLKQATLPPRPQVTAQRPLTGPSGLYTLGARGSNNLCLDPTIAGKTPLFTCRGVAPPQAIRYDGAFLTPVNPSREKNGLTCIDASNMGAPIQACTRSPAQAFKFDFKMNMFRNPIANLCVVDRPDVKFDVLTWCDQAGKPLA